MSQIKQTLHGKNKRIFANPHKISSHLVCSICLEVFEQPSRLLCGHTFCFVCIQQWANSYRKNICPECKCDFSKRKVEKDFIASKLVDQLVVKCIHEGCNWQGQNCRAKKHQRACQYKEKKNKNQPSNIGGKLVVLDEECQEVIQINQKQARNELLKNARTVICYNIRSPTLNNSNNQIQN